MAEAIKTLTILHEKYKTPEDIMDLFRRVGIIKEIRQCSRIYNEQRCPGMMKLTPSKCKKHRMYGKCVFVCDICGPKHPISPFIGTLFTGSRKPLSLHLEALWYYGMNSTRVKGSESYIDNVSKKTLRKWFRIYRVAIQRWMNAERDTTVLGGPGRTVEIDESCFSKKRKYNRGSGGPVADRWVFGMVERSQNGIRGRCLIWLVPNRRRETLIPLIERHIHPATKIISDNYSVYYTLGQRGWDHEMVNHSMQFVESYDRNVHTETIEGLWQHIKNWINGYGGTRDRLLQERLDEWRFFHDYMRRDSHDQNFWKMLRVIGMTGYQAKVLVDAQAHRAEIEREREMEMDVDEQ